MQSGMAIGFQVAWWAFRWGVLVNKTLAAFLLLKKKKKERETCTHTIVNSLSFFFFLLSLFFSHLFVFFSLTLSEPIRACTKEAPFRWDILWWMKLFLFEKFVPFLSALIVEKCIQTMKSCCCSRLTWGVQPNSRACREAQYNHQSAKKRKKKQKENTTLPLNPCRRY